MNLQESETVLQIKYHSVTQSNKNTVKLCDTKKNKYHRVTQSTTQRNTATQHCETL